MPLVVSATLQAPSAREDGMQVFQTPNALRYVRTRYVPAAMRSIHASADLSYGLVIGLPSIQMFQAERDRALCQALDEKERVLLGRLLPGVRR